MGPETKNDHSTCGKGDARKCTIRFIGKEQTETSRRETVFCGSVVGNVPRAYGGAAKRSVVIIANPRVSAVSLRAGA